MDFGGSFDLEIEEMSPCGRYVRYKKILGRGAFKEVYKGFDLVDGMEIAWYQISIDDDASPEAYEQSCFEAVLLKSLAHNNVMKCYCHWIDDKNKRVNIMAELFNCGNLRQHMKKLGNVDQQMIKNWGKQILQGIHYLHTLKPKIVHRDLKCENIFVNACNAEIEIKIGDFGLSILMEEAPIRVLVGTPEFMATEYYDEEYDELVDIYAFGMCLLEMATLEYPYSECINPAQIFKKVCSGIKPAALGTVEDLEVKEMIERCLSPASVRPSALQLLNDPFFSQEETSYSEKNSMIISADSPSDSAIINEISSGSKGEARSCLTAQSDLEMLGDKFSGIDDTILSDISMLYNSTSAAGFEAKMWWTSCCDSSSVGDASMHSRITFEAT